MGSDKIVLTCATSISGDANSPEFGMRMPTDICILTPQLQNMMATGHLRHYKGQNKKLNNYALASGLERGLRKHSAGIMEVATIEVSSMSHAAALP